MKTIGLIGGTTWHSTLDYYRYFNEMIAAELGEPESAKVMINSLNFGDIKKLQAVEDWDGLARLICEAARALEDGGADCIMLGANTIHRFAEEVESTVKIPLIHIARETAKEIKIAGIDSVALLGTRFTMQMNFFKDTLAAHEIKTFIPEESEIEIISKAIDEELSKGMLVDATKKRFVAIIDILAGLGADGVVLGCTEIPLLIKASDCPMPVFDTTCIHAKAGVNFALGKWANEN